MYVCVSYILGEKWLRLKCHDAESNSAWILLLWCPGDKKPSSEAVAEYLEGRKKYEELRKQKRHKGSSREEQVNQYTAFDFFYIFISFGGEIPMQEPFLCLCCLDRRWLSSTSSKPNCPRPSAKLLSRRWRTRRRKRRTTTVDGECHP